MPKRYNGLTKARPRPTAKSLSNLKPAKKGEPSRNPRGGQLHNPLLRAFKSFGTDTFREVLEVVMKSDFEGLKVLMGPTSPSFTRLVANAMSNAIESGNYDLVERIADRLIGKVPDKIDLTANTKSESTSHTELAIRTVLEKIESDV